MKSATPNRKRSQSTFTECGSIGPVKNLESYVKADWWKHIFNANYLRTDSDVVEDSSITRTEIDWYLNALQPAPDSMILDLCCGQGRHALAFAAMGYSNVVGLDRSHYLINRARKLSRSQNAAVTFKEGDARRLPFKADRFDFVVILGNSFGYFESLADDLRVINEVMRALKPNGRFLIDLSDGDHMRENYQPRSWEWIDRNYFVCRERALSADGERLVSREVITHVKRGAVVDQFYAERLYTKASITNLLEDAGFADVEIARDVSTESKRNQDLGMMAKRFIVTATAAKSWSCTIPMDVSPATIAVVLGDPGKADAVKPDALFDADDFQTIDRLKSALQEYPETTFLYLNNHDTLVDDLQRMKNSIELVVNLCDEGFNNDPLQELHVPALLEALGIPYSGGTPRCLAYCYDKSLVRGVATEMDIPVPEAYLIKADDVTFIDLPIGFPVIVKPNFGDSSFGITQDSVCNNVTELENAIIRLREKSGFDKPILVEQFLTGIDLSVGIIGNPPESYNVLPIIEEDYSFLPTHLPRICGYEAKWDSKSPYWNISSRVCELPEATVTFLTASCIKLFERLECRDYARFDWRLDSNDTPRLLEVNPNPGWCWDGHLAKMAEFNGMSYSEMLRATIEACRDRIKTTTAAVAPAPPILSGP